MKLGMRTLALALALATSAATPAFAVNEKGTKPGCNAPSQVASLRVQPGIHRGDVLHLHIVDGFTSYQRAKLLQAVNDWNDALKGTIRFEIAEGPQADLAPVWQVFAITSRSTIASPRDGYPLAVTMPIAAGGGVVMVNTAEIGSRDVAAVMRHELGHMLGLCHDPSGGLMAAHYSPYDQTCIDKGTLAVLADYLAEPASDFRGCERR